MIKTITIFFYFTAFLFATRSQATSDSETLSYGVAQKFEVHIVCKPEKQGMLIQMVLREGGFQSEPIVTSLPEAHPCKDVVSINEDFDGDGVNDIAVNDLSMMPNTSRQIFLVSVDQHKIYSSGLLPIDADKDSSGNFINISSTGGSIIRNRYSIEDHRILVNDSLEKVISGNVCTSPVKAIAGIEDCKGKLLTASFERPICIKHAINRDSARIISPGLCNFSL